jgi:hypothetical protein
VLFNAGAEKEVTKDKKAAATVALLDIAPMAVDKLSRKDNDVSKLTMKEIGAILCRYFSIAEPKGNKAAHIKALEAAIAANPATLKDAVQPPVELNEPPVEPNEPEATNEPATPNEPETLNDPETSTSNRLRKLRRKPQLHLYPGRHGHLRRVPRGALGRSFLRFLMINNIKTPTQQTL